MRYDLEQFPNHMQLLLDHAALEGDDCPVDDICDSIPMIVGYVRKLQEWRRISKSTIQRLDAEIENLHRKLNNVKNQTFRKKIKRKR
jgi:hypothetical protein